MDQARRAKKVDAQRIAELEDELVLPPFPQELAYLWRVYHRLRRRSKSGFSGPDPIGWMELDAFLTRTKFDLAPWEIEVFEAIDDAFLAPHVQAVVSKYKSGKNQPTEMHDVSDVKSIRSLMRKIGKRRSKDKQVK